jgi:hypothetical protein
LQVPITLGAADGTFGALTVRVDIANVWPLQLLPWVREPLLEQGVGMRLMHVCYAALGFAVARWIFHRKPVVDPVVRFRVSGLM